MWKEIWLNLDSKRWPQRAVAWALRRRARSRLHALLFPRTTATNAISLFIAAPAISIQDLATAVVPETFGSWRDYAVKASMSTLHTAVAILVDPREHTEFTMTFPVHAGFPRAHFKKLRKLRLTRETERSCMLSVRDTNGMLIASGTIELIPRAAFSRKAP